MQPFFTRERFGRPQFLSGLLLLAFAAQVIWLIHTDIRNSDPDPLEQFRIDQGLRQWNGEGVAGMMGRASSTTLSPDTERSPLIYLASSAPLLTLPNRLRTPDTTWIWRWLPRLPFFTTGLLLGASLWYVARRLCTNLGGFVALILYCFSPGMIQAAALWRSQPSVVPAWGSFGAIFTAIAVAHTLYAPREVVLWNWRRITLLGISLALAIGSQFSMAVVVPLTLVFLLYVAPVRLRAGFAIWAAGCAIAAILFAGFYFFRLQALRQSLAHAVWIAPLRSVSVTAIARLLLEQLLHACPAFMLLLPLTLIVYIAWRRTRYFGNTAPLLVALLFCALALFEPHASGAGFLLSSALFLFVFVAGVIADLAETRFRELVLASLAGLLGVYALWNIYQLTLLRGVRIM